MTIEDKILDAFYNVVSESKQDMYEKIASDRTKYLTVVLENIHKDHNASAVLRSCDCFGIQNLHVIEKNNRYKVQRDIAVGAGKWVDVFNYDQGDSPTADCLNKLKKDGYKIVATTPHENDVTIHQLPIDSPIALVFGTEKNGISKEVVDMTDEFVKVPMYGFTESFNISVSAALALNVLRERLEKSVVDWRLKKGEQTLLKIKWCKKILRSGEEMEKEFRRRLLK